MRPVSISTHRHYMNYKIPAYAKNKTSDMQLIEIIQDVLWFQWKATVSPKTPWGASCCCLLWAGKEIWLLSATRGPDRNKEMERVWAAAFASSCVSSSDCLCPSSLGWRGQALAAADYLVFTCPCAWKEIPRAGIKILWATPPSLWSQGTMP